MDSGLFLIAPLATLALWALQPLLDLPLWFVLAPLVGGGSVCPGFSVPDLRSYMYVPLWVLIPMAVLSAGACAYIAFFLMAAVSQFRKR